MANPDSSGDANRRVKVPTARDRPLHAAGPSTRDVQLRRGPPPCFSKVLKTVIWKGA